VPVYVAMLRGINLGAKRRLAMADLRELLEGLGYDDVRTHLQSGNVILRTTGSAAAVKKKIEAALATHCGFDVDVVVRTKAQLDKVLAQSPFEGHANDNARYLVVFLEKAPPAAWRRSIDAGDYQPDEVAVHGKEIYLWLPKGVHDSKLAREATGKGVGTATARNWNVLTKLAQLAADPS
jgi:uncharacterized protein (DUF1697 family)